MFRKAQEVLVDGVNSPVRSFRSVGRANPLFISRASGSKIYDVDGNCYIDYVGSWGASILGAAPARVVRAVTNAAKNGLSFGAATEQEVELAEMVHSRVPSVEMMRFVSSGTEATMSAVRLARAFTKRDNIVKFDGCYHGHADSFLVRAGSGLATFSVEDSAGITTGVSQNTLVAKFNDLESVTRIFEQFRDIACVIVEPVAGNMGVIPPSKGFLEGLRKMCNENGSLLIFDEIITGFRLSQGGAQEIYGVTPDLTCLGKVIGGGMNIAAYGGRKDVMKLVSPLGPVYQAGTLSGNPVAVSAGIATLRLLTRKVYQRLEDLSSELANGFSTARVRVNRVGSMVGLFFVGESVDEIRNYDDAKNKCSIKKFSRFFNMMLERGVYLPPSPYETIFVSAAHSKSDIRSTVDAARECLPKLEDRI
jgi:glutamate-1-semialdehyde 2,1-aminomutase